MEQMTISFDEWVRSKYDGIGDFKDFKGNMRETICRLLKHVLNLGDSSTLIGGKRLAKEYPCWSDPSKVYCFWLFRMKEIEMLRPFVDEYKRISERNSKEGELKNYLPINRLAERFKKSMGDDELEIMPNEYLLEILSEYVDAMDHDDVDLESEICGVDIMNEIQMKTGYNMENMEAMGMIDKKSDVKKIIREYGRLEEDKKRLEKESIEGCSNDVKKKEQLEKRKGLLSEKEKKLEIKKENFIKQLEDFPFGSERWFNTLTIDEVELFDMLYEDDEFRRINDWEKVNREKREKLVFLLRKSFEYGNLSKIVYYFDVDLNETQIMYPNIAHIKIIEWRIECYCKGIIKIKDIMQSSGKTNEKSKEIVELGNDLLGLWETISSRRLQLSHLLQEMQKLIEQYETKEDKFYSIVDNDAILDQGMIEWIRKLLEAEEKD